MEVRIDKRITSLICIMPLVYFAGISLYSFVPDLAVIPEHLTAVFYWVNNTVFVFSITYISSVLIVPKKAKYIMRGTSIFTLILGIFQIINQYITINELVWVLVLPAYLVPFLIIYNYVRS